MVGSPKLGIQRPLDGCAHDRGGVGSQRSEHRLGHVTRARVTQIMNLLYLAPDIQDAVLHLPRVTSGKDPITERDLRPICAESNWAIQRRLWSRLTAATANSAAR